MGDEDYHAALDMSLDEFARFKGLNKEPYKAQAIWFLNAFWKQGPSFGDNADEAESVWVYKNKCVELDKRGEEGNELNEFDAHRVLESLEEALTVKDMRAVLSAADVDFNKYVSLIEFLLYKYKVEWKTLINAPQGNVDQVKLKKAQDMVEQAQEDMRQCELKASEAKCALMEASHAEMDAKRAESQARDEEKIAIGAEIEAKEAEEKAISTEESAKNDEAEAFRKEGDSRKAEEAAIAAENEQKQVEAQVAEALAALQREEDAYNKQLADLEAAGNDDTKGIVSRNRAKNELAQLKCKDPLPLQRAKINQEAVVRRQKRATRSAGQARAAAEGARVAAEAAREEAVKSREAAEEARQRAASRRANAEKTRAAASESRAKAEESRKAAEAARATAEEAKQAADDAVTKSVQSFQDATDFLETVKRECAGAGQGKIWWMDRELEEAKKYMSQAQLAKLAALGK